MTKEYLAGFSNVNYEPAAPPIERIILEMPFNVGSMAFSNVYVPTSWSPDSSAPNPWNVFAIRNSSINATVLAQNTTTGNLYVGVLTNSSSINWRRVEYNDPHSYVSAVTTYMTQWSFQTHVTYCGNGYYHVTIMMWSNDPKCARDTTSGNWYTVGVLKGGHTPMYVGGDGTGGNICAGSKGTQYAHITNARIFPDGTIQIYYNVGETVGQGAGWCNFVIDYLTTN